MLNLMPGINFYVGLAIKEKLFFEEKLLDKASPMTTWPSRIFLNLVGEKPLQTYPTTKKLKTISKRSYRINPLI